MKKIIVFTSNKDHEDTFKNAVHEDRWKKLHEDSVWDEECSRPQFAILTGVHKKKKSCIYDQNYDNFKLIFIYEPQSKTAHDGYQVILNHLCELCRENCNQAKEVYPILHRHSEHYHDLQIDFVRKLAPNADCKPEHYYSHTAGDNIFFGIAAILEAARDSKISLDEYNRRIDILTAALSFPELYDHAASIQIELFRRFLKGETEENNQQISLQDKYKSFTDIARMHDPNNNELDTDFSTKISSPQFNNNDWDDFTKHLNQILLCSKGLKK